jgi:hypothetical protein
MARIEEDSAASLLHEEITRTSQQKSKRSGRTARSFETIGACRKTAADGRIIWVAVVHSGVMSRNVTTGHAVNVEKHSTAGQPSDQT